MKNGHWSVNFVCLKWTFQTDKKDANTSITIYLTSTEIFSEVDQVQHPKQLYDSFLEIRDLSLESYLNLD